MWNKTKNEDGFEKALELLDTKLKLYIKIHAEIN